MAAECANGTAMAAASTDKLDLAKAPCHCGKFKDMKAPLVGVCPHAAGGDAEGVLQDRVPNHGRHKHLATTKQRVFDLHVQLFRNN